MAITGSINLSSTFDDWRVKTNETIVAYNLLETSNIRFYSNTPNILSINGTNTANIRLIDAVSAPNTIFFEINALPTFGGTVNGTVNINTYPFVVVSNTDGLFLGTLNNSGINFGNVKILTNGHIIIM